MSEEKNLQLVVVYEGSVEKYLVTLEVFDGCIDWAQNMTCVRVQTFFTANGDKFCLLSKDLLAVYGEDSDDWHDRSMTHRHANIVLSGGTKISIKMTDGGYNELMEAVPHTLDIQYECLYGRDASSRRFGLNVKRLCSISRVPASKGEMNLRR